MSKKWIYEGEMRAPKSGEHYLYKSGSVGFVPPTIVVIEEFPIVHPIPDDVVMVPREKIEALRIAYRNLPPGVRMEDHYEQVTAVLYQAHAILACAEPAKPKDEILEALRRCRNTLNRDRINCTTDIIQVTDEAIALREKELEERDT